MNRFLPIIVIEIIISLSIFACLCIIDPFIIVPLRLVSLLNGTFATIVFPSGKNTYSFQKQHFLFFSTDLFYETFPLVIFLFPTSFQTSLFLDRRHTRSTWVVRINFRSGTKLLVPKEPI